MIGEEKVAPATLIFAITDMPSTTLAAAAPSMPR